MTHHTIGSEDTGKSLVDWLCSRFGLTRPAARDRISSRQVRINGSLCTNPTWRLRAGARVEVRGGEAPPAPKKREHRTKPTAPRLCFVDEEIVIVDKPAGLTTMRHADEAAEFGPRGRRFLPATLEDLLPALLPGPGAYLRAVHRLDRDTTGLVVFARTPHAERHLGRQFRDHTIDRVYQAVVRGLAVNARIESRLVPDRGDGRRGSTSTPGEGQLAITHVKVLEHLGSCSRVECRLETGRTHQVRIHLGEAGTPLCGERIYDRPLHGKPLPDPGGIERVALHAQSLGLEHPKSKERLTWYAELPRDMARLIAQLQSKP